MGGFGKANQHLNKKLKVSVWKCVCEALGNMIRLNGKHPLTRLNNKVNNVSHTYKLAHSDMLKMKIPEAY